MCEKKIYFWFQKRFSLTCPLPLRHGYTFNGCPKSMLHELMHTEFWTLRHLIYYYNRKTILWFIFIFNYHFIIFSLVFVDWNLIGWIIKRERKKKQISWMFKYIFTWFPNWWWQPETPMGWPNPAPRTSKQTPCLTFLLWFFLIYLKILFHINKF